VVKSNQRAEEFYKKGCDKGNARACTNLQITREEREEAAKKARAGLAGLPAGSIPTRATKDSSTIQTTAPH
jgi:hypothetical protein